jgi:predicted AAA+ superfamily ATPase
MKKRSFWVEQIGKAWERRSVIWLSGVRRVGKTFLSQSLADAEYFDCELPRVRAMLEDAEGFLRPLRGRTIILDEIHRLQNPSELLKISADHYPEVRILATGSSTLGASAKFKDTLTGRKESLWLTPMLAQDLVDFGDAGGGADKQSDGDANRQAAGQADGQADLAKRLLFGGLPPFYLSETLPERNFQDWMDGYWAKDIQELFHLGSRHAFQRFFELLMGQSGGIFEASRFTGPCEVSRPTISNYLSVLEATYVAHIVRPFNSNKAAEVISAPKVYGFDTGFVCYYRGWHELRREDMGLLWEHYVLNEMQGRLQIRNVLYWRDKRGHEIDFVIAGRGRPPVAIECKWSATEFDPGDLQRFRERYPEGVSLVAAADVEKPFVRNYKGIEVTFVSLPGLIDALCEN